MICKMTVILILPAELSLTSSFAPKGHFAGIAPAGA
jgi:hypothetical protein